MEALRILLWTVKPLVSWWGRLWMRLFGCQVDATANVYGRPMLWMQRGTLRIGKRVTLYSIPAMAWYGQEFPRCFFSSSKEGIIEVGDDSKINASSIHAHKHVSIGKRCLIGPGCRIADINFHAVDMLPRHDTLSLEASPILIEDDVWLGAETIVFPGVSIGHGSVIGARSIVTKSIPPMSFAAGTPAQVIRPVAATDQVHSG